MDPEVVSRRRESKKHEKDEARSFGCNDVS
jgi:hypothetical protein